MISNAKEDLIHTLTSLSDRQRGRRERRATSTLLTKRRGPEDKWLERCSLSCGSVWNRVQNLLLTSGISFLFSMYAF